MRMRWLMVVVLVVFGLAVAGCGGSDSGSGTETEAVATETTSSEETTTTEETTSTETTATEGSGVSGVLSEDCAELIGLSSKFAEAFGATSGQPANLDESAKFFEEFADRVPEEIRDDFQVVAQNYTKIAEALKDIGPLSASSNAADLAEAVQKLQEATKDIDQAEVSAAATRIGAWASANCNAGG